MAHDTTTDADARSAVIRQLAETYDRFAEEEQVLIAEGRYGDAQDAHECAVFVLRAYRAELDDPPPAFVP